jgi:pimeloyl-ACP methyl ester carboxylesterase
VQTLALLEPALPAVLFTSPEVGAFFARVMALYTSGDKAGAIDAFAQEVAGAQYRLRFDQTLPPGYFERWVADADTIFQSDMPALQDWRFTVEEAARITQPVLNVVGANTTAYFREIHETVRAWLPQAENLVLPGATHTMLQTQPQAIAGHLAAFFARHPLQT